MISLFETIGNLFKKKEPKTQVAPLKLMSTKKTFGLQKPKEFAIEVAVTYDGKPVGRIAVSHKGYSRDKVAEDANQKLGVKVISCVQRKSQNHKNRTWYSKR